MLMGGWMLLGFGKLPDQAAETLLPIWTYGSLREQYGSHYLTGQAVKKSRTLWMPVIGYETYRDGKKEKNKGEKNKEEKNKEDKNKGEYAEVPDKGSAEELTLEQILAAEGRDEEVLDSGISYIQTQYPEEEQMELFLAEQTKTFQKQEEKVQELDLSAISTYENLIRQFYTVDKSTIAGSDQLQAEKLQAVDLRLQKEGEGPQILIYHTHSQEGFADSVAGDPGTTIVGVGAYLARCLRETYGYEVLHVTEAFDLPSRDDAYSVALPYLESVLKDNPQIQVVLDLHRDAVDESVHLVSRVNGKDMARIMFFNGLSRTRTTGQLSYLKNDYLDTNLAFSFQMQKAALEYYPGLTRKIYLKAYRYNMHLKPRTLLVEMGAQNNTLQEALNACEPLAHLLDLVLSGG